MKKQYHASVRLEESLHNPLKEEADEKFEGNMSFLIRNVLRNYVDNKEPAKNEKTAG